MIVLGEKDSLWEVVLVDIGINEYSWTRLLLRVGERSFSSGLTATRLWAILYSNVRRASVLRRSSVLQFSTFFSISVTLAVCSYIPSAHLATILEVPDVKMNK